VSDFPPRSTLIAPFRRLFATGAALLVLLLATLAASPQLHNWLHHGAADDDDGCAVVLFSNGVALPLGQIALTPPTMEWQPALLPVASEIFLAPARYLRQPERGPPVG
jgi:hypothetical protein